MDLFKSWLRCDITKGMFPGEYTVVAKTVDGQKISLFAPSSFVNEQQKLLAVRILEKSISNYLVFLPVTPMEISSRVIKVAPNTVVQE